VRLQGIGAETNVASFIVDATAGGVAVASHCVMDSFSQNGAAFRFNIRYDRLPMGWVENGGTITNQGSYCFQAMPALASWMTFTARGTNFVSGHHYSLSISNVTVDSFTGAEFNAGRNWFTNMAGPIWAQRTNVVNAYLDLYGLDHTTLLQTHSSGNGVLPYQDIIGFKSTAAGFYDSSGHRGTTYVSDMATTVAQLKNYDKVAYDAAQPVTYQMVITDLDYIAGPRLAPYHR
jgi:muramidase (phage lysozyme)